MRKAGELITTELENNTKAVSTQEEIQQVASISAQDEEVGKIIAQAMNKV